MATVEQWTPYGVALNITATAGTIKRISATQFTVVLNTSWIVYWNGASTIYGMSATSGGVTKTITSFGTAHSSGSASFTGTYSISGNSAQTKSITVTFKNFNTETGASSSKNVTLSVSVPAWTTYAVKYNANGGTGAPAAQTKVKNTTLKLSSTKPTRTGYTFKGWGTTASDTTVDYATGANYTANAAITLYAIWQINSYTITYNANGGTGAPASQTVDYNTTITISETIPTKSPEGDVEYVFKGWGTTEDATTASYQAGSNYVVKSNTTLYAVWSTEVAKWDVVYNANGGTNAPENQVKDKDVVLVLSSTIPVRVGYNFSGWSTSPDGTTVSYAPEASYETNEDLFLYAVWIPFVHTVMFDLQGGTNSPSGFESTYGDGHIISNTEMKTVVDETTGEEIQVEVVIEPEKDGYAFRGWNTSSDGTGTMYQMGDVYNEYQDGGTLVLYACWVDKSIRIYKTGICHCVGFKEIDDERFTFNSDGLISAYEFVEGDCVKLSSNGFVFTELIEK